MAGRWIPEDWLALSPAIRNFTENPSTVQFDHRTLVSTRLDTNKFSKQKLYSYKGESYGTIIVNCMAFIPPHRSSTSSSLCCQCFSCNGLDSGTHLHL